MELACPNCGTRFRVPEGALGTRGRQVRCGSCGHAWRASPEDAVRRPEAQQSGDGPAFAGLDESARAQAAPAPDPRAEGEGEAGAGFAAPPSRAVHDTGLGELPADDYPLGAYEEEAPRRRRGRPPPPPAEPGPRWGVALGWILFVLIVVGLVAGGWQFRGQIVERVPETQRLYDLLGVRVGQTGPNYVIDWKRVVQPGATGQTVTIEGQVVNATQTPLAPPQLVVVLLNAQGSEIDSWAVEVQGPPIPSGGARDFSTSGPWPSAAADAAVRTLE